MEVDLAPILMRQKAPGIGQISERALGIFDLNLELLRVQLDIGCKPLAEHPKTNDQVSRQGMFICLPDTGGKTPWQKFRIAPDIRNERVQVLGTMRDDPPFRMDRHVSLPPTPNFGRRGAPQNRRLHGKMNVSAASMPSTKTPSTCQSLHNFQT